MIETHPTPDFKPDDVVAAFNVLGYEATFAAVAAFLHHPHAVEDLYAQYPSREVLGLEWVVLRDRTDPPDGSGLGAIFQNVMDDLFIHLGRRRDFSRAWIGSMSAQAGLHAEEVRRVQQNLADLFASYLDALALGDRLSLPASMPLAETRLALADGLAALAWGLVLHWWSDRTPSAEATRLMCKSVSCLLDLLLMARADTDDAGALWHLHALLKIPHERTLKPLMELLLPAGRSKDLVGLPAMVELVRNLGLGPQDLR